MLLRVLCFSLLFFSAVAPLRAATNPELDAALAQSPKGTQVALLVQPLDGGVLQAEYNTNLLLPPASTQKLLTALASELQLGADYRFKTTLLGQGRAQNGNWRGDLKLQLSGAPDLSRAQLGELLDQLKARGIARIDGDLLLDGRVFSGYERARGWPWDNLGVCYSAPASAFTIEHNCVAASLDTKVNGNKARLFVPAHQPVAAAADVDMVSASEKKESLCDLRMERGPGNRYQLSGCVTKAQRRWPLNFAVNDTAAYLGDILQQELHQRGIVLTGKTRRLEQSTSGEQWQTLAQVSSAPLASLLEEVLQHSDNLYADNLLKTLGAQRSGIGSFEVGAREVIQVLREQAGLDLGVTTLKDGSGLSRDNQLSAQQLAAVLSFLNRNPQMAAYQALPVAGQSGTLKYRRSLREAPLSGTIRAKSGTVNGSSNLAGFLQAASGKRYLFVLMVSGIARGDDPAEMRRARAEFERNLLLTIHNRG